MPERAGARGPGWKRAAAFNLVGCLGAIVQLGCLWMLSGAAGIHYAAAAALSTEVAVLHNFLWHQRWTWRDRPVTGPASLARLWRFNASNGAISLAVALVMMPLLVGGLGLPVLAANLCAIGVASLVNLVVSDTWVFRARLGAVLGVAVGLAAGPVPAHAGPSKAASIAFRQYIERVEVRQAWRAGDSSPFLWVDSHPGRTASVRAGVLAVEPSDGEPPPRIPGGLVHDWTGTVFVPGTDAAGVLALLQDYDRHRIVYGPDVVESQLLARDGNRFHVRLRLSKHMVVTVVLETVHDAAFVQVDGRRWQSRSATTEIREVRGAGTAGERLIAAGDGHGFLWSLRSYWRFEERDGGVYVECRAVSLSRDIPAGLGWLIGPVVRELPRESLVRTLEATWRGMRGAGTAR